MERDKKHQQEINTVQDNTSLVTKTPWLRYTRWDKKFTGQDMNELHALTDPPQATTAEEKLIWDAVGKTLERCWEGYHNCLEREWSSAAALRPWKLTSRKSRMRNNLTWGYYELSEPSSIQLLRPYLN